MTTFTPSTYSFELYQIPPMRVSFRVRLTSAPGTSTIEKTRGQVWPHGRW